MAQSQSLNNFSELGPVRDAIANSLPRLFGRIRKLKTDKGFGFVAGDDGQDYFFHWSAFKKSSPKEFKDLQVRDRVAFSPIQPQKMKNQTENPGPRAIEIEYVEG